MSQLAVSKIVRFYNVYFPVRINESVCLSYILQSKRLQPPPGSPGAPTVPFLPAWPFIPSRPGNPGSPGGPRTPGGPVK